MRWRRGSRARPGSSLVRPSSLVLLCDSLLLGIRQAARRRQIALNGTVLVSCWALSRLSTA